MVVNKCEFKPLSLTFKPLVLDQCLSARCCSVALPLPTTTSSPSLAFSRPDVSFITEELTALSREDVGLSPSNGAWQSTRWTQQLRDDGLRSSSSSSSLFFFSLSLQEKRKRPISLALLRFCFYRSISPWWIESGTCGQIPCPVHLMGIDQSCSGSNMVLAFDYASVANSNLVS